MFFLFYFKDFYLYTQLIIQKNSTRIVFQIIYFVAKVKNHKLAN